MFTEQTGKFPHLSSRGNRYQMILYHVASNSIWVEPMKNRTEGEIIKARDRAVGRMNTCGIKPTRQIFDNEASTAYKEAVTTSGMTYQLVPPDDHRRNVAEKAIQTWKDHFIAALSGTPNDFPLHLWCQVIPQMERQLCLLRQTNINPKISTYAHLYGPHNYNAVPFVPIGMQALVHDKPQRRKSFAQHCSKGWVIETSPEHYRCWKVWNKATRTTRISATMFFKHKYITTPTVTPADIITAAAHNLAQALQNNMKALAKGETNIKDLKRLKQILSRANIINPNNTDCAAPRVAQQPDTPPPRVRNTVAPPRVPTLSTNKTECPTHPPTSPPAMNTRSRRAQTITQETMLRMLNIQGNSMTAKQSAHRRLPKEVLAAVLNVET
jgi:hypothetical protein